jgi:UPF0716 protein FxsA
MWLLIPFIVVPLIEIALFVRVGGLIGLWPTLGIVLATAIAGSWLVRTQGRQALAGLKESMTRMSDPTEPLAHGAMVVFAGMLLLTPGFFTDAVGLALLVPAVRRAAIRRVAARVIATAATGQARDGLRHRPGEHRSEGHWPEDMTRTRGDVIDGEFIDLDTPRSGGPSRDDKVPPRGGQSGWTRP